MGKFLAKIEALKEQRRGLLWGGLILYAFTVPLSKSFSAIVMGLVATWVVLGELRRWREVLSALVRDRVFLALAVFTALYYLGLINTEDMRRGYKVCKNISIVLGTYIVLALTLRGSAEGERVLRALLLGTVALVIGGWTKFLGLLGGPAFRLPSAVVMNPIWFGNVAAVGLYISLAFLCRPHGKAWPWAVAAGVCLSGLFLSMSRGAWAAAAVVSAMVFLPRFLHSWRGRAVLALVVLGLGAFFLHPSNRAKVVRGFEDMRAFLQKGEVRCSLGARLGMWSLCLDIVRERPLTGAGTGDYILEVKRRTEGRWAFLRRYNQPHSIYFHALAMHGLPGLVALLGVFFVSMREALRGLRGGSFRLGLLALAVLLHYMVAGLTETVLKIHVLVTIFGMVLGSAFGSRTNFSRMGDAAP